MHCLYNSKHLTLRIAKWHNSCNIDPSVLISLSNMHCLMVMVWRKFERQYVMNELSTSHL